MDIVNIPDFIPVLSRGGHTTPKEGACFMEMAAFLAGEAHSDSPVCTHPVIAAAARTVNDRLSDGDRQRLAPLIPRVIGTASDDRVLGVRLAVWCARQVLGLVASEDQRVVEDAIVAAEAWCDNPTDTNAAKAYAATYAAYNAYNAAAYAANAANAAANAAAYAAYAAYTAATYAANAATYAANAAANAVTYATNDLVSFLTGLLDQYDRLTGRTQEPCPLPWTALAEAVGS